MASLKLEFVHTWDNMLNLSLPDEVYEMNLVEIDCADNSLSGILSENRENTIY